MGIREAAETILNLVYPKKARCMGCGSAVGMERDWLCESCRVEMAKRWVGAHEASGMDGAAAAYRYEGPAGSVVRQMKFRGVTALSEIMTEEMLNACHGILPTGADCVMAVPMHVQRQRQRGFNQSQILAKALAKKLELPYEDGLKRIRNTPQQSLLSKEERLTNLADAFVADERARGKRVLLVDDVYTTGATARECAKALRAAGATAVYMLTYAIGGQ